MQYAMSIWSVMMRDGKSTSTCNASLLVDQSPTKKFNAASELVKFFIGKSNYSLPAIVMAIFERVPIKDPESVLKIGDSLREELKAILGKFD
jgi:signal recognition particle receptor subunit beta